MDRVIVRRLQIVGMVVIAACAFTAVGAAPRAQAPATPDPIAQLLVEVHGLRMAMEQQAAIGPRVQLTLARLSIEEQRISHLSSQLDTLRERLSMSNIGSGMKERVAEIESRLTIEVDPAKRSQLESEVRGAKQAMAVQTAMEQRTRERENELAQALASEQARWNELSVRLDDLERLMGPVR